ncbi:hypothetical protein U9M48_030609 [Paspalum notatum var. saurae]|uniref:Protein kinase domain-containing protein n=1 Tax=Paspalum notatum var. saurae TaxID=547442 RepID=A0AAQ3U3Y1_PASNO
MVPSLGPPCSPFGVSPSLDDSSPQGALAGVDWKPGCAALREHEHAVWPAVLKIIQGIAKGVRYLHHQTVVHLDLKPESILLDADMTPKITNFGKAREVENGTNEITVENFCIG